MKKLFAIVACLMCALLAACTTLPDATPSGAPGSNAPLVLISLDALRADYLDRGLTPNLKAMAQGGVSATMHPSFPTLTFPNHYTLVTGKVPDHHGMIANNMYDPTHPADPADPDYAYFMARKASDGFWWQGATPMWVSAEQSGQKVGIMFWPGSEAEIDHTRPTYWQHYDKAIPATDRVAQVLKWMDLPEGQRPKVFLLYFDMVDEAGHNFGVESPELNDALRQVDTAIGVLRDGMKQRGIVANMIVVSDHGMAPVAEERTYYLSDLLGTEGLDPAAKKDPRYDFVNYGTVAMLNPAPGQEALIDRVLVHSHYDHMRCWHKGDIPKRLNFGSNRRIPEIVCLADDGWLVGNLRINGKGYKFGAHGYDPRFPDMNAIFIADGPSLKTGVRLSTFDNVNVYDLEMKLLNLKPLANDGSLAPFGPALKSPVKE